MITDRQREIIDKINGKLCKDLKVLKECDFGGIIAAKTCQYYNNKSGTYHVYFLIELVGGINAMFVRRELWDDTGPLLLIKKFPYNATKFQMNAAELFRLVTTNECSDFFRERRRARRGW